MSQTPQNLSPRWAAPFFTIWTGQAFSLLGSQLVQFALIWWLTQKTGSATVLATASLAGLLPQVIIGPLAGALVDRWSRRLTMMFADGIIALATLALALLFWSGQVQIWHIYALMLVRSTAGGFHWPAMQASTSLMVPQEHLSRIQGLNQMLAGAMNIVAAPLGALLLSVIPMQGVLAIDIITASLAITPLFFISVPQPASRAEAAAPQKTSVWQDMAAGWRYVASWPGLLIILFLALLINMLINPAFALLPILVTRHFNGQALHLASLESALGVGVVAGGLTLSVWGGFKRRIITSFTGLLGMAAAGVILGVVPADAFTLAVAGMFLFGFFNPITNGPLFAVLQAVVAPDMQGRVFTLVMSVSAAMTPLGLIIAGPLADRVGVQAWFLMGGVFLALTGIAGFFIPAVMKLEEGKPDTTSQLEPKSNPSPAD